MPQAFKAADRGADIDAAVVVVVAFAVVFDRRVSTANAVLEANVKKVTMVISDSILLRLVLEEERDSEKGCSFYMFRRGDLVTWFTA